MVAGLPVQSRARGGHATGARLAGATRGGTQNNNYLYNDSDNDGYDFGYRYQEDDEDE